MIIIIFRFFLYISALFLLPGNFLIQKNALKDNKNEFQREPERI